MKRQTHEYRAKQTLLLTQLPSSSGSTQGSRAPTVCCFFTTCSSSDHTKRASMWSLSQFYLVMYSGKTTPVGRVTLRCHWLIGCSSHRSCGCCHSLLCLEDVVSLISSTTPSIYNFSTSSSAQLPEPWGEEFGKDVLFRTECSEVSYSIVFIVGLCVLLSNVGISFCGDGWVLLWFLGMY